MSMLKVSSMAILLSVSVGAAASESGPGTGGLKSEMTETKTESISLVSSFLTYMAGFPERIGNAVVKMQELEARQSCNCKSIAYSEGDFQDFPEYGPEADSMDDSGSRSMDFGCLESQLDAPMESFCDFDCQMPDEIPNK